MRVVSVVGTRPQLIKEAALQPALRARHDEVVVDTGQHWDDDMAGVFVRELGLAPPDHVLDAGGGTHARQTAMMLAGLEPILREVRPDAVVVYGDTNSTLAATLAASKLGLPVAHVEAGLRSFDRRMPEEVNRIVADHLAAWRFAPTPAAVANLAAEGLTDGVLLVGDVMADLASRVAPEVGGPASLAAVAARLGPDASRLADLSSGGFLLATIHRQENRSGAAIAAWTSLLARVARPDRPVVLALHPGTRAAAAAAGIDLGPDVIAIPPQGYRSSLTLQLHAAAVLTDSGGVQRESAWLGVPCLVLRSTTEWLDAVEAGAGRMVLVGLDADLAARELDRLAPPGVSSDLVAARLADPPRIEGGAAERIAGALDRPAPPRPTAVGRPGPPAVGPTAA